MGRVVAFSEFDEYASALPRTEFVAGTILDTNILVSASYELKNDHEEVVTFLDRLADHGYQTFTTVNTKAEFLDFHRRMTMTEYLRDLLDPQASLRISKAARAQIQVQSGQLAIQQKAGGDPVFSDRQLKKIKSAFTAGLHSGQVGWLLLCRKFLAGRLDEAEGELTDSGVKYISQHEPAQAELFYKKIDWPDAKRIAEVTCLGLADAMILNALQCSRFPFVVSADFDLGYAALSSAEIKDVVMPDDVATKYRGYRFDS